MVMIKFINSPPSPLLEAETNEQFPSKDKAAIITTTFSALT